jgi:hypothetical protein
MGFRSHSGWAALVVVKGPLQAPTAAARTRIELADPAIPGSKQPYHAAEKLPFNQAEKLVTRCVAASRSLARQALQTAIDGARQDGHAVVGCGILLASGRPLTTLADILASHALIHTAEGELFRNVIVEAARELKLPIIGIKEKELLSRASKELRMSVDELQRCLANMGRTLGPPWRQDEKYAALIGWLALVATTRRN